MVTVIATANCRPIFSLIMGLIKLYHKFGIPDDSEIYLKCITSFTAAQATDEQVCELLAFAHQSDLDNLFDWYLSSVRGSKVFSPTETLAGHHWEKLAAEHPNLILKIARKLVHGGSIFKMAAPSAGSGPPGGLSFALAALKRK